MSIKQPKTILEDDDNFGNLKETEPRTQNRAKEVLKKSLHTTGDAFEAIGEKIERAGFKKVGETVEKLGDKIEHLAG